MVSSSPNEFWLLDMISAKKVVPVMFSKHTLHGQLRYAAKSKGVS